MPARIIVVILILYMDNTIMFYIWTNIMLHVTHISIKNINDEMSK